MNNDYKILIMGLLASITSFLQSCTNGWSNFQEGEVNGKKYVVQTRSESGYFNSVNSIMYRLRYAELPYIPIDANTTNWDVVYSTAIFGNDSFEYISTEDSAYTNTTAEVIGARTFLYLIPDDFSKQEYDEYVRFFKSNEWKQVNRACVEQTKDGYPFPHIVGLVYGDPAWYIKNFKGMYLNQEYIFRVENDGRVKLVDGAELGEIGTGLSPKVQMPGKIIYFSSSSGGITSDELKNFKNEQGQSPLDHFTFLPAAEDN